ncbi:MAG: 30S ribosomal protein S12 methylthiotransferase RimO [Firmicutes bacterium]|nr:30S ribosomal protein S12 methylthiotransferase RimO [Bacillota bacterium]
MKIYFETLGCPKNFNDTQTALGYLLKNDITAANSPEDADVIVVNTCGFINDAKRESIEKIFDMLQYKDDGKKVIISGCLSQRYSKELAEEIPEADAIIGVNDYEDLPDIIKGLYRYDKSGPDVFAACAYPSILPYNERILEEGAYSATLKIAEGCDNCCAYCVIPSIRGGFRSKAIEDVLSEAEDLASRGIKEIILIAQDVTNYGTDLYGRFALPELLRKLVKVEGIEWIRLMYCYEDRITDELIEVMATEPKICHYIDVPIQHSSDKVLREMYRRSTGDSIRNTMAKLRAAIPDIAIRTTLIVGFPGETEDDFDDLIDFVEEESFQRLGVFAYSQEEGTPAGDREDQVPEEIKQERLDQVMRLQLDISYEHNQELIGKVLQVLTEEKDPDGSYVGRSRYDAPEIDNSVIFTSNNDLRPGDLVMVHVDDAFDYDLVGHEVEESK